MRLLRITFCPAVSATALPGRLDAPRPSIVALTLMSVPAVIVSGEAPPGLVIE